VVDHFSKPETRQVRFIMEQDKQNPVIYVSGIRTFATIFFKYKRLIISVFLVVGIVGTVIALSIPATYQAEASLLVRFGREYMYRSETPDKSGPTRSIGEQAAMNNEIQILTNRDLLKQVISTVGVEKLYPGLTKQAKGGGITPEDIAIPYFEKDLKADIVKNSNVIEVSFKHKEPQTAAATLNTLITLFGDKHLTVYMDPKSSFLEEQFGEYRERLGDSEKKLQDFRKKHQVYSLDDQRALLSKQRMDLDASLKTTQSSIREGQQRLTVLNNQQRTIMDNPGKYVPLDQNRMIGDAQLKLSELQLKEQDAIMKYNENSRVVTDIRKQIETAKIFLARQEEEVKKRSTTASPIFLDIEKEKLKIEADLKAQEARADSLRTQIGQMDGDLRKLDFSEKEFQGLKREIGTNEQNYKNYLEKYEETRINDDLNKRKISNVSILQSAAVPAIPVKRDRQKYVLLSLILGIGLGFGLAVALESIPQQCTTPLSAEKHLGLPILVSIALKK
jgi:polysaccharide biosynthesis protein PslE